MFVVFYAKKLIFSLVFSVHHAIKGAIAMSSPNRMQQMEWDEYLDTTNGKDLSTLVPIVYSKNYAVKFCGLQKLHPFDAAKGEHVLKFLIDGNVIKGDNYMQPLEARKIDLQKVHTKKYLKSLKVRENIFGVA